jgi:hypothetical protein
MAYLIITLVCIVVTLGVHALVVYLGDKFGSTGGFP